MCFFTHRGGWELLFLYNPPATSQIWAVFFFFFSNLVSLRDFPSPPSHLNEKGSQPARSKAQEYTIRVHSYLLLRSNPTTVSQIGDTLLAFFELALHPNEKRAYEFVLTRLNKAPLHR
jgi:hypothetical protein